MKTSDEINELAAALSKAQGAFDTAAKTTPGVHNSKYATLSDVYKSFRKPLSENGLSYVQFPTIEDGIVILTTRLMHSSGQWMEDILKMRPIKPNPHEIASCITYMRRYAICSVLGVDADEDDDGNAASGYKKDKEGNYTKKGSDNGEKRIYLNVPYDRREEAKRLDKSVRYDGDKKQWYTTNENSPLIQRAKQQPQQQQPPPPDEPPPGEPPMPHYEDEPPPY